MPTNANATPWFAQWFDSPYYHLLYAQHNDSEAAHFAQNITNHISLPDDAHILDLACGRGRFAIWLSRQKNYTVLGTDLAANSIKEANLHAHNRLKFQVQDMREPVADSSFDLALNLFTSFGYFDDPLDNQKTVCAAAVSLKPQGRLLIDFMNTPKVIEHLVGHNEKTVENICFKQSRQYKDGFVYKDIDFEAEGTTYHFQEKVQALHLNDFEHFIDAAGLKLQAVWGNYDLEPYNPKTSERLIVLALRPDKPLNSVCQF